MLCVWKPLRPTYGFCLCIALGYVDFGEKVALGHLWLQITVPASPELSDIL